VRALENKLIHDPYRPINNFGYFFMGLALLGFLVLFLKLTDVEYLLLVWAFVGSVSLLHFLLGIGILLRKRWGFIIFKGYLHLLYLGFPLGTYLARETLKYIDEHRIEEYLR
jgi:hypothetical protein